MWYKAKLVLATIGLSLLAFVFNCELFAGAAMFLIAGSTDSF